MINEQGVLWIVKNRAVYIDSKENQEQCVLARKSSKELTQIFKEVIRRMFKAIAVQVQDKGQSVVDRFAVFSVKGENEQSKRISEPVKTVSCQILAPLRELLPCTRLKQQFSRNRNSEQLKGDYQDLKISQAVCSFIKSTYLRALTDLVKYQKTIKLEMGFGILNLGTKVFSFTCHNNFIHKLNEKPKQVQMNKFSLQFDKSISKSLRQQENDHYKQAWESEQLGKALNLPHLRQIKDHLNKGWALELKYRQLHRK